MPRAPNGAGAPAERSRSRDPVGSVQSSSPVLACIIGARPARIVPMISSASSSPAPPARPHSRCPRCRSRGTRQHAPRTAASLVLLKSGSLGLAAAPATKSRSASPSPAPVSLGHLRPLAGLDPDASSRANTIVRRALSGAIPYSATNPGVWRRVFQERDRVRVMSAARLLHVATRGHRQGAPMIGKSR